MARPYGLTLDIRVEGDRLSATVFRSISARGPLQRTALKKLDLPRIEELSRRIAAILACANRWGDIDRGSSELLRQQGAMLFDQLLPQSVKETLRDSHALSLEMVLDEALLFVPWELMHTGHEFVGRRFAMGRVLRTEGPMTAHPRPMPGGHWNVLIVCDPRGDLMGSYYEGVSLRDDFDARHRRLKVDFKSTDVSVSDVRERIREYDVVHFAGHAEHNSPLPSGDGWLLSDGVLRAEHLLELTGGKPFPRLVFSNACRSVAANAPDARNPPGSPLHALAQSMLIAGVQHYVGSQWDVPDEPACHFALATYTHLLEGASIGLAMQLARSSLVDRYGDDTVLWASYVLYGSPTATYFDFPRRHRRDGQQPHLTPVAPTRIPMGSPPRPSSPSEHLRPRAAVVRTRGVSGVFPTRLDASQRRTRLTVAMGMKALLTLGLIVASFAAIGGLIGRPPPPNPGYTVMPLKVERSPVAIAEIGDLRGDIEHDDDRTRESIPIRARLNVSVRQTDATHIAEPTGPYVHLRPWDAFRLSVTTDEAAYAEVWHISAAGTMERIHPRSSTSGPHVVTKQRALVLPAKETWFLRARLAGSETFILAANSTPKVESAQGLAWDAEPLLERLRQLRRHARRHRDNHIERPESLPSVFDRTVGDDRPLLRDIIRLFQSRYDAVDAVHIGHDR